MPTRDSIHDAVVNALVKEGWEITDDPFIIQFGGRTLFIDLAAHPEEGFFIGAEREQHKIAVEIKSFGGASPVTDLEHAIGQYVLYHLVLDETGSPETLYLAVTEAVYRSVFERPLGRLAVRGVPLRLVVVNEQSEEVAAWIDSNSIERP